jgi:putative endonuclease
VPNLRRVGRAAEDRAAEFLLAKGFTLVTRRFKGRRGEIDLVCMDGDCLVFVEVRERRAPGYVPEETIGDRKAAMMRLSAAEYIDKMGLGEPFCRFDVVAMDASGIRHHEDVFGQ